MTAPILADALGPRARRRIAVATAISGVLVAGFVVLALQRLATNGQLESDKWQYFTDRRVLSFLWTGLRNTLSAAVVAMAFALVVGGALALGRLSRRRPLRWVSGTLTESFRAFPVLLLILFSYLVLDRYFFDLSRFWYLVMALVAYNGAVLGEVFRAGILSLDRGQTEAAQAIGLSHWQTMSIVVLPQAIRRMVPAIVSQLVTLLKDTALGQVIGFEDLLKRGQLVGELPSKPLLPALLVVTAVYVAVNFALSRAAHRLEIRQRRRYRAGDISVSGIEDLAVMQSTAATAGR